MFIEVYLFIVLYVFSCVSVFVCVFLCESVICSIDPDIERLTPKILVTTETGARAKDIFLKVQHITRKYYAVFNKSLVVKYLLWKPTHAQ